MTLIYPGKLKNGMFPEELGNLDQMQNLFEMKNISKMCEWENVYKGGGY